MSKEVGEMVRSRDVVQAEGSARTEGARRATGVRADGAAAVFRLRRPEVECARPAELAQSRLV